MKIDYTASDASQKGRNGDKFMAHVAPGEMVVPPVISDELRERLHEEMIAAGIDPDVYTVGEGMSINPETGLPEFGFGKFAKKAFKSVKKAVKKVASSPLGRIGVPLALSFAAPGLGTALGGALGATGAGASALGSGLIGAGMGAISGGGLKGALAGGISGGAGGYLGAGGSVPGLGSVGGKLGAGGMGPPTPGTGVLGSVGRALSGIGKGPGAGGGQSMFSSNSLSNVLSGVNSYNEQEEMEDDLLEQQRKAQAAFAPYQKAGLSAQEQLSGALAGGFDPTKIGDDPGYKFNLEQGNKALDRAASARGSFFSGRALTDAQDYGTNLANTYVNDYFSRWSDTNSQLGGVADRGLNAAGSLAGTYDNVGNIKSNARVGMNNSITGTLASILSGSGARAIVGRRKDGTPIYEDDLTQSAYGA